MLVFTSIASGSSGNSSVVSSGDTHILIDGGISARRICLGLQSMGLGIGDISAILVTHKHTDHIGGLPVLLRKYRPMLYATDSVRSVLDISGEGMHVFRPGGGFCIGGLRIQSFPTPHDSEESCGFVIQSGKDMLGYATDLGHMPEEIYGQLSQCGAVVLESNYDAEMLSHSSYPVYIKRRVGGSHGHLCNDDCAQTALRLVRDGCRSLALAHLSRENNTPGIACETTAGALRKAGAAEGVDFTLLVLPRDEKSPQLRAGGRICSSSG